jgi:hypothetical protein
MNRNEFVEQYTTFVKRSLELAAKARRESFLGLSGDIDQKKVNERDIFEYGLKFVLDGIDSEIIKKMLDNIITQEKDEYTRLYKTIQREAVLGIQQGYNSKILLSILNSLTDIPLADDKAYAVISSDSSSSPNHANSGSRMATPGNGKLTLEDGAVYEGETANGKPHGKGKTTYPDGTVYEGDFAGGKRNGNGKLINSDGSVYIGTYVDDMRNGKGRYTWADGGYYEGDLVNEIFHGKGKYVWANGRVYEGDFTNGDFHGKGKYIYADGSVYEGDFANDKRNGQGRMTYPDGRVEEGEWKDGEFVQ